jgi:CBS domain-containing protein
MGKENLGIMVCRICNSSLLSKRSHQSSSWLAIISRCRINDEDLNMLASETLLSVTNVENAEKIMTKKVITCSPNDTLLQVQQLMVNNSISRVVIVDANNKPVGIITQKGMINFLVADKSRRGIEEIKTEEVMTKKLITTKREASISNIAKTMVEKSISSVIIVDGEGKLDGIVTKTDITAWYSTIKGAYKVQEFMTAKPEADMAMMSRLLKPAKVLKEEKPLFVKGAIALPKNVYLLTAGDIMTADPMTVSKSANLVAAAKLMTKHKISGLPVTDKGKLVGIITKSDIIRAAAHEK